jgi:hypothetical protein
MIVVDDSYPLSEYFLSEYLAKRNDPTNFLPDQVPDIFGRYEFIFCAALNTLQISKENLRGRPEFDFSHADQGNFESGIAVLRAVDALRSQEFSGISLLKPPGADIICERNGLKVCCEVKAITKLSTPRKGLFFADQLHAKVLENLPHARKQLATTARNLQCTVTMFVCVSNWFDQAIYLKQQDYQDVVNRLEKEKLDDDNYLESLNGIDVVFFATKLGQVCWFVKDELRTSWLESDGPTHGRIAK